jgi:hypothetical protein
MNTRSRGRKYGVSTDNASQDNTTFLGQSLRLLIMSRPFLKLRDILRGIQTVFSIPFQYNRAAEAFEPKTRFINAGDMTQNIDVKFATHTPYYTLVTNVGPQLAIPRHNNRMRLLIVNFGAGTLWVCIPYSMSRLIVPSGGMLWLDWWTGDVYYNTPGANIAVSTFEFLSTDLE